ncbi:UNVERIFIED_CONTAM: hypothetical protein RKD43_002652 [Streptomyces graminofaciens]
MSWSMAQRLAGDLAGRTGTPAPDGVPPAAYLAAVVNERQARDARRAFTAAAREAASGQAADGPAAVPAPPTSVRPDARPAAAAAGGPPPPRTAAPVSADTPPTATSGGFAPPA